MDRLFGVSFHRLALVALCLGVGVALLTAAGTSDASFSMYNWGWDGTSELRSEAPDDADVEIGRSTGAYQRVPPNETVAVVLSPVTTYDARDRARVRQFVRRGGTIVLVEDFGSHTNDLLRALDAEARIDGDPVRDLRHYYPGPAMPVARNVSDHPLTEGVDALSLNYATIIDPDNATVLVRTSRYSYVDRNRNEEIDFDEQYASYPVVTVEPIGEGSVIVVGDPSIATNSMIDLAGNRAFIANVLAGHEHVLFDYSHAEPLPPLAVALLVLRNSSWLQIGVGFTWILLIAFAAYRPVSLDIDER